MPDFDTRQPQESDEPNGLGSRSLTNRVQNSLIANRLRTLLIGGGILLFAVVGISVGLDALPQVPLGEVPNGKIAFQKDGWDIYVTNPDGTGVRNLTNSSGVAEYSPAWSPDGEKIAFEAAPPYDLFVMNADGSGWTQLTDTLGVDELTPAWSPDGEKIAVTTSAIGTTGDDQIYVMNTDGSGRMKLTDTSGVDDASPGGDVKVGIFGAPVWSPDSEKIAFTRSIGDITHNATADSADAASAQPEWEESGIYVVNADGRGQSSILNQPAGMLIKDAPAWSPDGERIAFESGPEDTLGSDIYVMNANGWGGWGRTNLSDGRTNLSDTAGMYEATPAWSPDGERIAFESGPEDTTAGDLYVMNADGTGRMRLTNTAEWPTWSPDGEYIAFWSGGDICFTKADGSTGRRCVANDADDLDLLNGPGLAWGRG